MNSLILRVLYVFIKVAINFFYTRIRNNLHRKNGQRKQFTKKIKI